MELTVKTRPWKFDKQVTEEEATSILVDDVFLNGDGVSADNARLELGTRSLYPPKEGRINGFMTLLLENVDPVWFASLGADDVTLYSTPKHCEIIIDSIAFVEEPAAYAVH